MDLYTVAKDDVCLFFFNSVVCFHFSFESQSELKQDELRSP